MHRRVLIALLTALTLAVAPGSPRAEDAPAAAKAPVKTLVKSLLSTMKQADSLGFQGRADKLEPVLRRTFDFPFMARLAVGGHWRKLSPEQQERLSDKFAELSIATFAARFDGYNGQTMAVQSPRPGPRDSVFVPTKLTKADGESVTLSYLLRKGDDGWQAVDVYMDGQYSELATKRAEFSSVLERKGFDALIARIDSKIAEMRGGDGS